jgi:hypothetical protein
MPERIARALGEPLVQAIDLYFESRTRLIAALAQGDEAGAQAANQENREALATWLALLVERLDSRNAGMLVDVLKRLENLETLMRVGSDPDDPTGVDAGRP